MSSPPPESPPLVKKPSGKPKFNKLKLMKKTPASQSSPEVPKPVSDVFDFFDRSKESYAPRLKSNRTKKRRTDYEGSEPPSLKKDCARGEGSDSGEDSGDDRVAQKRRRAALIRKTYEARRKGKNIDSDSDGGNGSKAREIVHAVSLTPSPPPPPTRHSPSLPPINLDDHELRRATQPFPLDDDVVITSSSAQPEKEEAVPNYEARRRARMRINTSTAPIVNILINSPIDNTKPLIIKRRLDQTLKEVRQHWCKTQGFSPAQTADIFLVWKGNIRVSDFVSCKGIGVRVGSDGNLDASSEGVMKGNIHFEAMTEQILQSVLSGQGADGDEREGEGNEESLRLVLKTKGKDEYKIKVRPTTAIASLIEAYKRAQKLGEKQMVKLNFEGEILSPEDTIADADLEDMCMVDVHIH